SPRPRDPILDTVRRRGGWRTYRCMTEEAFPFQQKLFFEEYKAWTAVEQIDASKLLTQIPALQLIGKAKAIDSGAVLRNSSAGSGEEDSRALTAAQIRDRREMLKQQAERFRSTNSAVK